MQDPSHALFNCTWPGTYPSPRLSWVGDGEGEDHAYASEMSDNLSLLLNRSALSDGQKLTCLARHVALAPEAEKSCTLTLRK